MQVDEVDETQLKFVWMFYHFLRYTAMSVTDPRSPIICNTCDKAWWNAQTMVTAPVHYIRYQTVHL